MDPWQQFSSGGKRGRIESELGASAALLRSPCHFLFPLVENALNLEENQGNGEGRGGGGMGESGVWERNVTVALTEE